MTDEASGQSAAPGIAGFLPQTIEGFSPLEADRFFSPDTLFDLIDGGAEIYRALNVRQTVHRRYTHPESNDIIADIFDMGSAADAFGAWHNDIREGESAGLGRESEYQGGSLSFWKDRYYVSVVALQETDLTTRAVRGIGRAVADAIPGDAPPPRLADQLPGEGLLAEQIYFFHDHQGLTRRYRLGDGNPLRLDQQTEGLLARYRPAAGEDTSTPPFVLLLIRYPSAEAAGLAHRNFRSSHTPGWKEQPAIRTAGGGWTSSCLLGDMVVVVVGAAARNEAAALIQAVRSSTEPEPAR
jgi:hypothetical protein